MRSTNKPLLLLLLLLYYLLIEINVGANFLIVSILVFVRKNSPEKKTS